MTIRNWFKFFVRAMLIGGLITGVLGLFIRWEDAFASYFQAGQWGEFFAAFAFMMVMGFTVSVIAQMGFFAYLTIHQMGVNIFRSLTLWNWVQILLIIIVIADLIIFRFRPGSASTSQLLLYLGLLAVLIGTSVTVAIIKARLTKKHALISALFFMIVVSTLEWLPVLMVRAENVDSWVTLLLFPILAVNAFQLLALPKYNKQSEIDLAKREERRKARKQQAAQ